MQSLCPHLCPEMAFQRGNSRVDALRTPQWETGLFLSWFASPVVRTNGLLDFAHVLDVFQDANERGRFARWVLSAAL